MKSAARRGLTVKALRWMIFAGWQIASSLVGLSAHHVDAFSRTILALMLMPGIMVSLFREGGMGNP